MSNLFLKKFRQSFWHHMLSLKRSLNYMFLAVPPIIYIPDKERILWVLSDDTKIKTNISIKCLFFFLYRRTYQAVQTKYYTALMRDIQSVFTDWCVIGSTI